MTKLCARGKSAAKRKFKVYPSAYANAYASKICAGKAKDPSGVKRKDWGPKKMNDGGYFDEQKTNVKGRKTTGPVKGGKTPEIPPEEFQKYLKYKKNKLVGAATGGRIGFELGSLDPDTLALSERVKEIMDAGDVDFGIAFKQALRELIAESKD